jgi:hypothetical protein
MNQDIDFLRYPIGRFKPADDVSTDQVSAWISELEKFPFRLAQVASVLSDDQLDTPYRPDGWTLRQVVHHLADSHMNAYVRFKLAMTEENPVIKPYLENRWAECEEARNAPIDLSLPLLTALHKRWTVFLHTLTPEDLNRTFLHPEQNKIYVLKNVLGLYVWHGNHHLAHITETIKRNGW